MLIDNLFVVVILRNSLLQLRLIVAFDRYYIKPNNITDLEAFLSGGIHNLRKQARGEGVIQMLMILHKLM